MHMQNGSTQTFLIAPPQRGQLHVLSLSATPDDPDDPDAASTVRHLLCLLSDQVSDFCPFLSSNNMERTEIKHFIKLSTNVLEIV
jgi:hypothetical protein